jgi:hypothetical protein
MVKAAYWKPILYVKQNARDRAALTNPRSPRLEPQTPLTGPEAQMTRPLRLSSCGQVAAGCFAMI